MMKNIITSSLSLILTIQVVYGQFDPAKVKNIWEQRIKLEPTIEETAHLHPSNEKIELITTELRNSIDFILNELYENLLPLVQNGNANSKISNSEKILREKIHLESLGLSAESKLVSFRLNMKSRNLLSQGLFSWIDESSYPSIANQITAIEQSLGILRKDNQVIPVLPNLYEDNLMQLESNLKEEIDAIPKVRVKHKNEPSIIMEMENPQLAIILQKKYDAKRQVLLAQNYQKVYQAWKTKEVQLQKAFDLLAKISEQPFKIIHNNKFQAIADVTARILEHLQEHITTCNLALNISQNSLWSKEQLNYHINTYNNYTNVENQ